jgi:hypothetical protein
MDTAAEHNVTRHKQGDQMNEEYEAIRAEMLEWQQRRIDVLKISTALIAGLLGLKILSTDTLTWAWPYLATTLLLFLAASVLLTWYAGEANRKLASYVRVFFEDKPLADSYRWETRLKLLNDFFHPRINLNFILVVVYATLAIASVLLPAALTEFNAPDRVGALTLLIGIGLFLLASLVVAWKTVCATDYDKNWARVKANENRVQ